MQTGRERRPLSERLSENMESLRRAQNGQQQGLNLPEPQQPVLPDLPLQTCEQGLRSMWKDAQATIASDIRTSQEALERRLNSSFSEMLNKSLSAQQQAENAHQRTVLQSLKQLETEACQQAQMISFRQRWQTLALTALFSMLITLAAVMAADSHLRGTLLYAALNGVKHGAEDFTALYYDTRTGEARWCKESANRFICRESR